MSPEQLEPLYDMPSPKSDVYAFGGFLIELFARTHPWKGYTVMNIKCEVIKRKAERKAFITLFKIFEKAKR